MQTASSTTVHLSDLASRPDQPFSEEELLLKRLGPDAVARSTDPTPRKPSLQLAPAGPAAGPRRWVGTSAVSQGGGGSSGGRRHSLVRRLSSLAGFKLPKSAPSTATADEDNANPPMDDGGSGTDWWLTDAGAANGGRRDSWVERLSSSVIAQRLDFLNTGKDSVARAVGRRAGGGPRPADESPAPAAPAPRPASVVTRVVRRLSMRRSQ